MALAVPPCAPHCYATGDNTDVEDDENEEKRPVTERSCPELFESCDMDAGEMQTPRCWVGHRAHSSSRGQLTLYRLITGSQPDLALSQTALHGGIVPSASAARLPPYAPLRRNPAGQIGAKTAQR